MQFNAPRACSQQSCREHGYSRRSGQISARHQRRAELSSSAQHLTDVAGPGPGSSTSVIMHHAQLQPASLASLAALAGASTLIATTLVLCPPAMAHIQLPPLARIPTEGNILGQGGSGPGYSSVPPEANLGFPNRRAPEPYGSSGQAGSSQQRQRGPLADDIATRAVDALARLDAAHTAVDEGRFQEALDDYSYVVDRHGDLALAEYARIGRALLLYQGGQVRDALLALEDEEVALRGNAEVHAALAALLWAEKPSLAFRAEQQFEVALEFDRRYQDPAWVKSAKHWPPRAVSALQRFLALQR